MPTDWGAVIGAIGQTAAAAAAARAAGRAQEAGLINNRNQTQNDAYSTEQQAKMAAVQAMLRDLIDRGGLDIAQRGFANDEIDKNFERGLRGDRIANVQDVKMTHPRAHIPNITGGYKPSDMSPSVRAMGRDLTRSALIKQLTGGEQFQAPPSIDPRSAVTAPPKPGEMPQSGSLDSILSWLGLLGSTPGVVAAGRSTPFTETRGGTTTPSRT